MRRKESPARGLVCEVRKPESVPKASWVVSPGNAGGRGAFGPVSLAALLGIQLPRVKQSLSCCRYDLQIRYLPEDFMESLKEDRTTLLYFYQQVKSIPVSHGSLKAQTNPFSSGEMER